MRWFSLLLLALTFGLTLDANELVDIKSFIEAFKLICDMPRLTILQADLYIQAITSTSMLL